MSSDKNFVQEYYYHLSLSSTWTGIFGATFTVLITTLDDSIWLMPFVATGGCEKRSRFVHAGVFLGTLMTLSFFCCAIALGFVSFWGQNTDNDTQSSIRRVEIQLECISVILCWAIASGFFIKKQLKHRRRLREDHEGRDRRQHGTRDESNAVLRTEKKKDDVKGGAETSHADDDSEKFRRALYGSISGPPVRKYSHDNDLCMPTSNEKEPDSTDTDGFAPMTVASLTALGFLDEISYFPTLIVGNVFSVSELILGTLFAGLTVLAIQVFLFGRCKPFIDFLDERVPLYAIIACFAAIMTCRLVWDIYV